MKLKTTERKKQVTVTTRTHTLTVSDAELRVLAILADDMENEFSDQVNGVIRGIQAALPNTPGYMRGDEQTAWVMTGQKPE